MVNRVCIVSSVPFWLSVDWLRERFFVGGRTHSDVVLFVLGWAFSFGNAVSVLR